MGAKIGDWILVALLLNNLNVKYKNFVHRLLTQLDDVPEFDKIVTLLYKKDRLLQRDSKEQSITAAIKRFNKKQENKKISRSNNDLDRGEKNSERDQENNNNNSNTNDRFLKNPNSSNYKGKGEVPECPKCSLKPNGTKKKHWPLDC